MGKKRKRAPNLGASVEIDPLYFVNPVRSRPLPSDPLASGGEGPETPPPAVDLELNSKQPKTEKAASPAQLSDGEQSVAPDWSVPTTKPIDNSYTSTPSGTHSEKIRHNTTLDEVALLGKRFIDESDQGSDDKQSFTDRGVSPSGVVKPEMRTEISSCNDEDVIVINDTTDDIVDLTYYRDEDVIVISDTTDDIVDLTSGSAPSSQSPDEYAQASGPGRSGSSLSPSMRVPTTSNQPSSQMAPKAGSFDTPPHQSVSQTPPSSQLPYFELTIVSKVPGKECTRTENWKANAPFYSLDREFGRTSVLIHAGTELKKFQTPAKVCPGSTRLSVEVVTELQWKQMELAQLLEDGDNTTDNTNDILSGNSDNQEPEAAESDKTDQFPITLDGKHGKERVLVSAASMVRDLVQHYLKMKHLDPSTPVRVKFDGDAVSLEGTVQDVDMEADDKLDIYV